MYFLAENKFDFNKLFNEAINYVRESEFESLKQKSLYDITKSHPATRQYSALSTANMKALENLLKEVDDFVYDKASKLEHELKIASFSLKKALDKKLKEKYSGTGIFLNYSFDRSKPTIVKKTRGFK